MVCGIIPVILLMMYTAMPNERLWNEKVEFKSLSTIKNQVVLVLQDHGAVQKVLQ